MAKKYDVIVVGAGPAGFVAARSAAENGFEVALLERKADLTQLTRACGQTLDSANEYLHHDLYRTNFRDKRVSFPAHGFSVKYDGPYRNAYSWQMYSPSGNMIQAGVVAEQKMKGDYGKTTTVVDKEILFRCLLEEVKAYGVQVFPGINVERVNCTPEGVVAEGSGQSFEGSYLIAADGVNSRIAQLIGWNKNRTYYCQLRALTRYVSGVNLPEPDACATVFGFSKEGPAMLFIFPLPAHGQYNQIVLTIHPNVDLEAAEDYFTKQAFCAAWFKNSKIFRTFSANENCYTPIMEAYKDRIFAAGDVGATQETEITGAMISGWRAGHSAALALQEEKLGLPVTATTGYVKWWQDSYAKYYNPDVYMKNWALPFILNEPEEIDYLFSLIKDPMPPCFNPYTMSDYLGQAMGKIIPTIQQERPQMLQKLGRMALPFTEIIPEVTKMSKPIQ
jgi:digeranylgeranylglycerophospholipid reductase